MEGVPTYPSVVEESSSSCSASLTAANASVMLPPTLLEAERVKLVAVLKDDTKSKSTTLIKIIPYFYASQCLLKNSLLETEARKTL